MILTLLLNLGADVVMAKIVNANDWLDEECGNMAREGLRTLVFGMRKMSEDEYNAFTKKYSMALTFLINFFFIFEFCDFLKSFLKCFKIFEYHGFESTSPFSQL